MSTEVKHSERAHARLSASGSDRWINCPASPALEEGFPEEDSKYAKEGTLAHEFAELMIKVDLRLMAMDFYRKEIEKLKKHPQYYYEIQDEVKPYCDYVKMQFAEARRIDPKAVILIEQKFNLSKYVKDGFGTSDCGIVQTEILEVVDLKFGKGKEVKAKDNPQLKYYALGMLQTLTPIMLKKIKTIRLTIVQPRMSNINSVEISLSELLDWGEKVLKPKALETEDPNAKAVAGDWCQFCKARAKCRTLYELGLSIAKQDFDILEDPRLLNDDELLTAYEMADFISKWCGHVKETVLKEAVAGKQWEGYKLVEGTSRRKYIDEAKVIEALEENLFDAKQYLKSELKGLGELEKAIGKTEFNRIVDPLCIKPKGAPTLVDKNDKRQEYGKSQISKDFDDDFDFDAENGDDEYDI